LLSVRPPECLKAVILVPGGTVDARQRIDKYFPAATNTHATIELLDVVFSMRSVSYQILNM
jgi:hypothetical protein